jgi:hypothetical protein
MGHNGLGFPGGDFFKLQALFISNKKLCSVTLVNALEPLAYAKSEERAVKVAEKARCRQDEGFGCVTVIVTIRAPHFSPATRVIVACVVKKLAVYNFFYLHLN